jgi:hypothetical protein
MKNFPPAQEFRPYSTDLLNKIESAKRLTQWLLEHQPERIKVSERARIAGAFFNIALDHHVGMVVLLSEKMISPAFSLARSVWEAYVRGLWARDIASDAELAEFIVGRRDPKVDSIIRAIKKHPDLDEENRVGPLHDQSWPTLNAYAHGGSLQIQRWITAESVEAAHSDEEIADLLRFANHVAFLADVALVELAEADSLVELFLLKGKKLGDNDWF